MRAELSITSEWCTIGSASCARSVLAAHPLSQRPPTTMARRTANPQKREALMNHPHLCNHLQEVYQVNLY